MPGKSVLEVWGGQSTALISWLLKSNWTYFTGYKTLLHIRSHFTLRRTLLLDSFYWIGKLRLRSLCTSPRSYREYSVGLKFTWKFLSCPVPIIPGSLKPGEYLNHFYHAPLYILVLVLICLVVVSFGVLFVLFCRPKCDRNKLVALSFL